MTMAKHLLTALMASAAVAVPLSFLSITIAAGEFVDVFAHPGFWTFYTRNFLWLLLASFLASALTAFLISRNQASK